MRKKILFIKKKKPMETKEILINKLDTILLNLGIVQDAIDKNKINPDSQGDKLKVGAYISKKMALEIEFKTIFSLIKELYEDTEVTVEHKAKADSLKYSLGSLVYIKDGKLTFDEQVQNVINGSK